MTTQRLVTARTGGRTRVRTGRAFGSVLLAAVVLTGMSTFPQPSPAAAREVSVAAVGEPASGPSETMFVDVSEGPGLTSTIQLDADLYLPASDDPAPAMLLAHGFGSSKQALAREAERMRDAGYVVLAYTARGFGDSGGRISLDSLDYEVADASALVDLLAERDEVRSVDGDPLIGVAGASYGGALALMLGATDDRIDTVVAAITWNDLAASLVPESSDSESTGVSGADREQGVDIASGVFKEAWAAQLFGGGASPRSGPCGRFTAELCTLYTDLVAGTPLDAADRELLERSSPDTVLDDMTAPTLLLQGTQDTLFGLDQAEANARQLEAAGAPVKVVWFEGGHDAGADTAGTNAQVDAWLTARLPLSGDAVEAPSSQPFEFTVPASARSFPETRVAASYLGASRLDYAVELRLRGRDETLVNPPGGLPATITSLPGVGSLDTALGDVGSLLPGAAGERAQSGGFVSRELDEGFVLAGTPTLSLLVAPTAPDDGAPLPTEAVLFAQLRVISGDSSLPVGGGGVAPIRVALPADGSPVTVDVRLPTTAWRFEAGDRVLLVVRTTDALFQGTPTAASFVIDTASGLTLPTPASQPAGATAGTASPAALVGIPIVLVIAAVLVAVALLRGRRRAALVPQVATARVDGPPLVIRGLTKDYRSGLRAVDDLSFAVERGQVLGLLGPNGAGKTTALRMVTGLLRPDAGEIEIFGERIVPGARVLSRVGCFIEGPGFLPHLSGRRNLQLYWAASGRPQSEARLDEALAIADLGVAVKRKVGGYSQGMRQRLAIAQAMLGMPELLILDEPTNGLDPPQIHALRGVLRRYAESGRTVIVSSHLLGEVEQTCSHVVVMAHGRLIAAGSVAELAGEASELTIEVTDTDAALDVLDGLGGVDSRVMSPGIIRSVPGPHPAETVVAALTAAGIGVRSVVRGRHLEETFLSMVEAERV